MNAILRNKQTKEIIKRGTYPRTDLKPVEGLNPALEWVLYEIGPALNEDETKNIVAEETEIEIDGIKKIVISFVYVDKSATELETIALERKRFAFESVLQEKLHTFTQEYSNKGTRPGSLAKFLKAINDEVDRFSK